MKAELDKAMDAGAPQRFVRSLEWGCRGRVQKEMSALDTSRRRFYCGTPVTGSIAHWAYHLVFCRGSRPVTGC